MIGRLERNRIGRHRWVSWQRGDLSWRENVDLIYAPGYGQEILHL